MLDENLDYRFMSTDALHQHWAEANKMKTAAENFRSQCRDMRFKSHQSAKAIKAMSQFRSVGKKLTELELHRGVMEVAMVSRGIKFETITGNRPKTALPPDIYQQVERAKARRKRRDARRAAEKASKKEAEDAAKIIADIHIGGADMQVESKAEEAARTMVGLGLFGGQEKMVDVKAMDSGMEVDKDELKGIEEDGDEDEDDDDDEMEVDGDDKDPQLMESESSTAEDEVAMILFGMQGGEQGM